MDDVSRFQERLVSGDRKAAQQLADAITDFGAEWFEALRDATRVIAKSGLAEAMLGVAHAD